MKGKSPEDELELAENALDILGGRVTEIQRYSLDKNVTRSLILVSKLGESPSKYPRRPGVPVRKPL
jgi:16S rRNA (guanine527-N7)-methyltransferase